MSQIKPAVTITLDKKRHLLLNINAMVAFEDATGKNMLQGANLDNFSAKDFRALLWACLIHEDRDLTLENVGAMIDTSNMTEVVGKLTEAWNLAMPEAKEADPLAKSPQAE